MARNGPAGLSGEMRSVALSKPAPSPIDWAPAPAHVTLGRGEILVFGSSLDVEPSRYARVEGLLSPDERKRAARFRFEEDRRRFITGRGLLRELLGSLLGQEPNSLVFHYSETGKPFLAPLAHGRSLHFNLAHTKALVVYAVSSENQVGIDIERLKPIEEVGAIAERFFSEREFAEWQSVPQCHRIEAFLNCWTRKEACLKATGQGIGESLNQLEVSLIPDQSAALRRIAGDAGAGSRWLLQPLIPGPDHVGAIAVPGGLGSRLRCWKWQ